MILRGVFLAVVVMLLLSACGSPPLKVTDDPAARQIALEKLQSFKVSGGLGVWTEKESISTRIDWQQNGQNFDVLVELPAGISSVRVSQKDSRAEVRRAGAEPVYGSSAAVLLQQALGLGVAVPVGQMSLWMRGLPGEQAESVKYDSQNRLASMDYRDSQSTLWRAKVLKYTVFDNVYVPALITATGGPYNVRLVLKDWSKGSPNVTSSTIPATEQGSNTGRLKVPGR